MEGRSDEVNLGWALTNHVVAEKRGLVESRYIESRRTDHGVLVSGYKLSTDVVSEFYDTQAYRK